MTDIFLRSGQASPNDIQLVNPLGTASATLAATEAGDTLAATGVLPIQATLAATEADDALSATAALAIAASLSITAAGDTLAATTSLPIQATLAATEASDALAATAATSIQEGDGVAWWWRLYRTALEKAQRDRFEQRQRALKRPDPVVAVGNGMIAAPIGKGAAFHDPDEADLLALAEMLPWLLAA